MGDWPRGAGEESDDDEEGQEEVAYEREEERARRRGEPGAQQPSEYATLLDRDTPSPPFTLPSLLFRSSAKMNLPAPRGN